MTELIHLYLDNKHDIQTLAAKVQALESGSHHHHHGHDIKVSFTINPGDKTVAIIPAVKLFNTQKLPFDINPVPTGGTDPDDTIKPTVTSSDASVVAVVVDASINSWELQTPNDTGSATITISSPGFEDATWDVSYGPFVPGQFNVVVGEPVPDTP